MQGAGRGWNSRFAMVALFMACLLAAGQAQARDKMPLPHFALPSAVDGKLVDSDAHKGQVMLVNFFATWCEPCRQEIPSFVKMQQDLADKGFTFIGLSVDQSSVAVAKLVTRLGINYPVAMADTQVSREFGGIIGVPTSFLVDRSGMVVKQYIGFIDHNTLERDVAAALR